MWLSAILAAVVVPVASGKVVRRRGAAIAPISLKKEPARGGALMSENAAVTALVKIIVGGGIMALPSGMAAGKGTGVVPALVILVLHACLSAYTFDLVGRAVELTGARDFGDLWTKAFSKRSAWLIDLMVAGVASGALLTYGCFLGDLISQLVPSVSRTAAIVALAIFPLGPLALAKDLSALKHSSLLGIGAVLLSAFVVVKRALDGTYADMSAIARAEASTSRLSAGTCVLFNMFSTAYMAHTNAVRAYRELADRSRSKAIAAKAFGVSAILYGAVMLAGYLTFGSTAKGFVLANYDVADPLALLARIATMLSLVGSHPLIFTAARDAAFSLSNLDPDRYFTPVALGLLATYTLLAILIPDAGFVVAINGASVGALLICVVPSMLYLNLGAGSKRERTFLKALVAFGLSIACFGTIVTCLENFTDLLS
ncbi:hypothetical protein CTAYLR_003454 [Chrysophaeum taylorii]|uniref:Amino acid transporter transmembrane domain-containing protein n=1 Tax=Chrysophaeum taylorii TaxID=2483200 RepID=A0AAD7U8B1_9STRA|nr:hypothetical protein CTAYLR_003454 [Chrysophaeum taylorii]